jgi:hypothetical protein
MHRRRLTSVLAIAVGISVLPAPAADAGASCAVTAPPKPALVAPPQYAPTRSVDSERAFFYGTPGLWALVYPVWKLDGVFYGNKMVFFSEHYNYWKREGRPPMTVEAKRLDAEAPLVNADHVNGAGPSFRPGAGEQPDPGNPGFMTTALPISTPGCWEITARYTAPSGAAEKLSYTVLIEP